MTYFDCIDKLLVRFFQSYGKFVARKPLLFLLGSLVLAIGLSLGLLFIELETDTIYLFTPDKSKARNDGDYMFERFPVQYNSYSPSRGKGVTDQGANAIVVPKAGNNVLTEDVIREILRFDFGAQNLTVQNASDALYSYSSLCAMWQEKCLANPILQAYGFNASLVAEVNITHPYYQPTATSAIFVGASLGDVTVDGDATILSAGLLALSYHLQTTPELKSINRDWEEEFLRYASKFESDIISISFIVSHSLEKEITNLTITILPYLIVSIVLLSSFSVASCLVTDWVRSKTTLAMLGLNSAALAVGASTGLLCYIGVSFNIVAASMPFLIMGIGIDDMFIMIAAWRKTNPRDSVEDRMGHTYSEAAVSITITSITDALAFGIGAISPLPAVKVFCLYTGVAVIFDYLFQITFFGACMVYSGRREADNRHCITLAKVVPRHEAKSKFYKLFCAGGTGGSSRDPDKLKTTCETALMTFFRDYYGPVLMTPAVKIFALFLFMAYISSAIYGLFHITEGLEMKKLAGDGSPTHNFFDYQSQHFMEYGPSVSVAIRGDLNYSDPLVRIMAEETVQVFERSDLIHSSNLTEFWLRDLKKFMDFLHIPDHVREEKFMTILVEQFLEVPQFSKYSQDIIFKDGSNKTEIEESRFIILGDSLVTTDQQMKMMTDLREIAVESEWDLVVFSPMFIIYEQFIVVGPLTLQNILIAVGAMFVIALLFIPHPFCAFMVTACIVSIQVGIIGYMSLWDVRLDGISMINIILCIGFSVDFSAHITYAFLNATDITTDTKQRHRKLSVMERQGVMALFSLGMPIVQGALSTILATLVMAFSPSYIFRTFFKIMFMVMVLGMVHSLIFLPALLSTLGAICCLTPKTTHMRPTQAYNMSVTEERSNQEGKKEQVFAKDNTVLYVYPIFGGKVTTV